MISNLKKLFLRFLILPWLLVFILREFGPIGFRSVPIQVYVIIALFLFFCAFGAYGYLGLRVRKQLPISQITVFRDNTNPIYMFTLMSLFFLIALSIDSIVNRGVLSAGVSGARMEAQMVGTRGSLLGALHTFLSGAPVVLACLLIWDSQRKRPVTHSLKIWFLVFLSISAFFLTGGRNPFFIAIGYIFCFYCITRLLLGLKIINFSGFSAKKLIKLIFIIMLLSLGLLYSLYLFSTRFAFFGESLDMAVARLVVEQSVDVVIFDVNELLDQFIAVLIFFVYYMSHSLIFFGQYFEYNISPNFMGSYSFGLFAMIFDKLVGTSLFNDTQMGLLQSGVYLSLTGSLFVDFGIIGLLICGIIIGTFAGWLIRVAASKKRIEDVLLLSYIFLLLLFAPVYSITNISQGPVLLIMLIAMKIMSYRIRFK